MENIAKLIIDEMSPYEEPEQWICKNDFDAEWCLKKISEERAETQRYINVCETMITEYTMKAQKAREQLENKTAYFTGRLQEYFATVPHNSTKTQETYKLPSGTLKKKFGTPEFVRDEKILAKWLQDNEFTDYYILEAKPKWKEFKESLTISGNKAVTGFGEIVDGVTVNDRPDTFEVET
ncbi:MAG: host-nuclease inhibitor Gam family protein [Phycisphaerae bacterium]|nr:host-nuclease inhibitor Gam family protein [Phycisphaerae bacterium]MDD5239974.1 host-nuclease inhibitor Gam family protein [Candidatus Nanoarchaeia archaeon]